MRPLGRPVEATGQRACEVRSGGRSAVGECTRPSRAGASSIPGCPQPRGRTEHCPQIAGRCRTIRSAIRILPAWRTVTHRAGGSSAVSAPRCCCSASAHPRRRPTRSGPRWAVGRWPASPAVLRGFDPPRTRYGPGHRGVDLAARAGEPVLASVAGTVAFAGSVAGRGVVSIDHGSLRTTYEPVEAQVVRRSAGRGGSADRPGGGGRSLRRRGACTGDCVRARRIWTR